MGAVRFVEGRLSESVAPADSRTGAVLRYAGVVRANEPGRTIHALHVEAFDQMAQAELERIRGAAVDRFGLRDVDIEHRVGRVAAGETILLVTIHCAHRKPAIAALDFVLDRLKKVVPVWKQEEGTAGPGWIVGDSGEVVR